MNSISKQRINYLIGIGIFICVIPETLFSPLAILFIGIAELTNRVNFLPAIYITILLYILSIIIIIIALFSLNVLNKKNWPIVKGTIVRSEVVVNPIPTFKLWTIKYTYSFNFADRNFFKRTYSKLIFNSEYEARKYLDKISGMQQGSIPVHVFKFEPNISSIDTKMNIFYVFYSYIVLLASSMLVFFGFLGQIFIYYGISTEPNQIDIFIQLERVLGTYLTNANITLLILPLSILILIILFLVRSLLILIRNKLYFFHSRLDPLVI